VTGPTGGTVPGGIARLPRRFPATRFDHLERLRGRFGLYEHAIYELPRRVHGYTTDDNARALVVLAHAETAPPRALLEDCTRFVLAGRIPGGWHNRLSCRGSWVDRRGSDDAHGRALWGLAHVLDGDDGRVTSALAPGFDMDSPHPRANAYAALAAAEAVRRLPDWAPGQRALHRFAARLPGPLPGAWRWPEERLTYANARIPHSLIAAGEMLGADTVLADGLELLAWLIAEERGGSGFSFTPVGGRRQGDGRPRFDQQPIEAWAMADACAAAVRIDGSSHWERALDDAVQWFLGRNDAAAVLYDAETGAGFDGLHRDRVNRNRGAESTLAALGALQLASGDGSVATAR
jgi:hypothetical protein